MIKGTYSVLSICLLTITLAASPALASGAKLNPDKPGTDPFGFGTNPSAPRTVSLPEVNQLPPQPGSGGVSTLATCDQAGLSGSGNIEWYNFVQPYGSAGWTDTNEGNNIYIRFNQCRTTITDGGGNRFAFIVYDETQNAGTNNHVESWYDLGYGWPTERLQMTPGSGQSIVDKDPDNHVSWGGGTLSLSLGYEGNGVGWSQNFPAVDIYQEYYTGAQVRWRIEENSFGYHGQASFTSTYGITQSATAGTSAQHNWWFEDRFHHYDAFNSYITTYSSPCATPGCGYNTFYTPLGA